MGKIKEGSDVIMIPDLNRTSDNEATLKTISVDEVLWWYWTPEMPYFGSEE